MSMVADRNNPDRFLPAKGAGNTKVGVPAIEFPIGQFRYQLVTFQGGR